MSTAVTAQAHPNLALIKYWGNRAAGNLPANGSIAVNLGGLTTTTRVEFDEALTEDQVEIDGAPVTGAARRRVIEHLDRVRSLANAGGRHALVVSSSDFPVSCGLASSASAFAALSLAATRAAGLRLSSATLSHLARQASGSACRSIPGGFTEWRVGELDQDSYAVELAPADHWDLAVISVLLDDHPKAVSSLAGHAAAESSPIFEARLASVADSLLRVRDAVLQRDFATLATEMERDAVLMHAVAMTSDVPGQAGASGIHYWQPATLALMQQVQGWRGQGLEVGFTIDAGANVHLLCPGTKTAEVLQALLPTLPPGTRHLLSRPGGGAQVVENAPRPAGAA